MHLQYNCLLPNTPYEYGILTFLCLPGYSIMRHATPVLFVRKTENASLIIDHVMRSIKRRLFSRRGLGTHTPLTTYHVLNHPDKLHVVRYDPQLLSREINEIVSQQLADDVFLNDMLQVYIPHTNAADPRMERIAQSTVHFVKQYDLDRVGLFNNLLNDNAYDHKDLAEHFPSTLTDRQFRTAFVAFKQFKIDTNDPKAEIQDNIDSINRQRWSDTDLKVLVKQYESL